MKMNFAERIGGACGARGNLGQASPPRVDAAPPDPAGQGRHGHEDLPGVELVPLSGQDEEWS
jgi:hypothetical protein